MHSHSKRACLPLVALAVMTAALAIHPAPATAQSTAASAPLLQLNTGRGRLIDLPAPMSDVFVANDAIADVQVRSPTQLYVFAKAPGETTVSATTAGGRVVYSATVRVGNNFESIQAMLDLAMPDAQITATPMNGLILLTGAVANPDDAAEAERLAQAFVGESTQVITRLRVATPLQVQLHVRIAEVSRTFSKNIGVNTTTRDRSSGFQFGLFQGRQGSITTRPGTIGEDTVDVNGARPGDTIYQFPSPAETGSTIGGFGRLFGLDILGSLDLGESMGQVTTLANPTLTALSGETATFLAGGEIPILISQGLGAISVEYKDYGVSLAYTPTVMSNGRISLRVRPEVSQLSSAGAVTLNNNRIFALITRRAETTVELGSGESLVIGGLLQNNHDNSIQKTPGLGDVPILGALFRSNGFQRSETELVIVVTPYLVRPVNANQIVLPTDGYQAPTDLGRIFMGQLQSGDGKDRPKPSVANPSAEPGLSQSAPLPAGPDLPAPRDEARAAERTTAPRQSAATPGFSN